MYSFFLCRTARLHKQTILWHRLCNFKIYAYYEDGSLILKHVINQATMLQLQNWLTYRRLSVFDWNKPCNKLLRYQLINIHTFVNSVVLMTVYWHHSWQYFWTFFHSLDSGRATNISNWAIFVARMRDWEAPTVNQYRSTEQVKCDSQLPLYICTLDPDTSAIIKEQNLQ